MIKNVIVVNDYDYVQGGASLVAIETANLLYKKGFNVFFFCGVSNRQISPLLSGVKEVVVGKFDFLNTPNKIVAAIRGLSFRKSYDLMDRLLSNLNPSETVVSIHGYTKALSTSFIRACKKYKVITILTGHDYFSICPNGGLFNYKKNKTYKLRGKRWWTIRNTDSRNYLIKIYRDIRFFYQTYINKFLNSIDYLITISKTNEELLKPFFANAQIIRIYNPTSISKKTERIKAECNNDFVYVGRLDKEKGVDLLCSSFSLSNENLIVIGAGNQSAFLRNKYKNSKNIIFLGWMNHKDVLAHMTKSKALIFSSLWHEGAPLTIFEAQSLGLPCIVSKLCNGSDFVDNNTGWIYDPYSNELPHLINSLDKKEIEEKSKACYRKFWEKPFTKERYETDFANLLKKIGNTN